MDTNDGAVGIVIVAGRPRRRPTRGHHVQDKAKPGKGGTRCSTEAAKAGSLS